ncbi:HlyD family efflux transporter periplasmic adaptor subunit [Solidesulfovibrio sp.]|uniref:HlyD family secretion protein n=1 Tax=Solidesulfovibrio sp. TaxID=2910990 RepID=UPI002635DF8F|nr:HlyD family efflux transporter periplasmic adaptor subunit [Solidesulfovibrio sp.]
MKTPRSRLAVLVLACILLAGCESGEPRAYQGYVEGEFVYVGGKISGRLDALRVARGDVVSAGQALYVLEHAYETAGVALAEADLRQAEDTLRDKQKGLRPEEIDQLVADLRRAEAAHALSALEYDRRIKLYGDAVIAKEDLDTSRTTNARYKQEVKELEAKLATGKLPSRVDQIRAAQAAVDAARAALDQARWNLGQMTQAAGVSGLVYDVLHYAGEWVAAGSPVVTLLPPQNVKVRFFVPEAVAGSLAVGQSVEVSFDGGAPATATVSYIAPSVEYTPPVIYSQGFREKLVIMVEGRFAPEVAARMHPGQPVDVSLPSARAAKPAGGGA